MKNIFKKIVFLTLVFSLFAFSCENDCIKYFDVKNNSNRTIYYGLSYSQTDFTLKGIDFIPGVNGNKSHKMTPGASNLARVGSSIIQVYIFDSDIIENTPWDTIVKYNMFLKRYQFTEAELEKMNYEIIYDGN